MAIRKPLMSVSEARRLANGLPPTDADGQDTDVPPSSEPQEDRPADESTVLAFAAPWTDNAPAHDDAQDTMAERGRPAEYDYLPSAMSTKPVEKVQVFVSALLPAPGTSWVFDQLCREYSPAKALQMILRRALDDYETTLENGVPRRAPKAYKPAAPVTNRSIVQTSRMMPVNLLATARAHFDPLGLESDRVFGRKLATAALATFFDHERKRSR